MKIKKGLTSIELETDIDKEVYEDVSTEIKSKINENDRSITKFVAENPNSTTTEIAEGTDIKRDKVNYSLEKLDKENAVRYSKKKNLKTWIIDNKEVVAVVLGISALALIILMSKSLLTVGEFKPEAKMEGSPEGVISQGILSPVVTAKGKGAGAGSLLGIGGSPKELIVGEKGAGAMGLGAKADTTTLGEQKIEGDWVVGEGADVIYSPVQEEYVRKSEGILSPSLGDIETGDITGTIIGDENVLQQQEAISQAGYVSTQQAIQEAISEEGLTDEQLKYLKEIGAI